MKSGADSDVYLAPSGIQHLQDVQPLGVAERERLQQHAVDDAEDRAVGADAESEGEQRRRGERRGAPHHPHRIRDVLLELGEKFRAIHACPPSLVDGDAGLSRCFVVAEALERDSPRALG